MNDLETRQPNDDELLDRLVDGELNETERRTLLEDFERRTDGWRKCALAFLEAQTFGTVLREHVVAPAPAESVVAAPVMAAPAYAAVPRVESRKSGVEWPRFLAAAASFLIACTAIMWYRGALNRQNAVDTMPNIAKSAPSNEMLSLTMVGDKPGTQQTVQLPLVQGRSLDDALRQPVSLLPQNVVQALEQRGHVVQQQRQLVPVQLQDGRRAIVPVDQVELRYVGNKEFQ